MTQENSSKIWDFIIVGSGFGGSVSALRLKEKGYDVLLLEKGQRFEEKDFPKTNWDLKRWLWIPSVGFRGLLKLTFFPHITILSGVGYGGGSLVYANTLPVPKKPFFQASSWAHLADWAKELEPYYQVAKKMLGVTPTPFQTAPDEILEEIAKEIGREEGFEPTDVGVYFGEPGETVSDPYFEGKGPERTGCIQCGGCMLGCRFGAKNTLDKNYLYLAERLGLSVETESLVTAVRSISQDEDNPEYEVELKQGTKNPYTRRYRSKQVVFSGGVLGSVDLLLKMKAEENGLPNLSDRLGEFVRTNSESLIGVISEKRDKDLSKGIAIGSILHTDEYSHLEPVRYSEGSGFWRLLMAPHVNGKSASERFAKLIASTFRRPLRLLRALTVPDFSKYTMILLYMRTLDSTLRLKLGRALSNGFQNEMTTEVSKGSAPTAFIPEATNLAYRVAKKLKGFAGSLMTETLLGIPTTAHILGGCAMGDSKENGVIDKDHKVFGYKGLYVVDGSAISANPGVNPSLTITALAERAMSQIPRKY